MKLETVKIEYHGLRWDGTIEGADMIIDMIKWIRPSWQINHAPYSTYDRELVLSIYEAGFGATGRTYKLVVNDMLICSLDGDKLRPEKVAKAHDT